MKASYMFLHYICQICKYNNHKTYKQWYNYVESDYMIEKKNIQIKSLKRDIYFEYLELKNLEEKYHLISVDSDGYNFIIPANYRIDYLGSNNIYNTKGHIYFYNDKYTYNLDYIKKGYTDYKMHMDKSKNYITKSFKNYKDQEFIEMYKNNFDSIYMFYNGYYFKIYSNHKLSLNEYYDMYFILFSITNKKINSSIELLRELYFFSKNAIKYTCNGEDILKLNLKDYTDEIELTTSDIVIYNNEEYLNYKDTKKIAENMSINLLSNNDNELIIDYMNDKWLITGNFKFGSLCNFYKGYIRDYNEITDSLELSIEEKKDMLTKIIKEKQYELDGYTGSIKKEFYSFLRNYLNRELSYELWNEYHIREFVDFELVGDYNTTLNDFNLYKLFMSNIYSDIKIFNDKLVMDSIKTEDIVISPNFYSLCITALNGLLNRIKIKFNEEFNLIFK